MKRAKMVIKRMLYPPEWILIIVSVISFSSLIIIFTSEKTESVPAYFAYSMSAYSLVIICAIAPKIIKNLNLIVKKSWIMKRICSFEIAYKYLSDMAFRGTVSIYQGVTVNFFYTVFRVIVGICYASVWFISMAVYYLILGIIRIYLIICYKDKNKGRELICYRNTACSLLLLNVPMGGMIILMIQTNSAFSYPGYVIYLSALYTFYTLIMAIRNLVKFRKIGNMILSAGKVLNFVSAMMSLLGLQTAMISRFSTNGDEYRKLMNTITGGCVYAAVIIIAVYMLLHYTKMLRRDMKG